jgi:WhiB family redox-sensing transcriptional regulator
MSTDWPKRAACRDKPHGWWFPSVGTNPLRAIAICETCPVRDECLEFALNTKQEHGVWGGMTPDERQSSRRTKVYCRYCGTSFRWVPNSSQYCCEEHRLEARRRNRQMLSRRKAAG